MRLRFRFFDYGVLLVKERISRYAEVFLNSNERGREVINYQLALSIKCAGQTQNLVWYGPRAQEKPPSTGAQAA
jgi:hypothetical protein